MFQPPTLEGLQRQIDSLQAQMNTLEPEANATQREVNSGQLPQLELQEQVSALQSRVAWLKAQALSLNPVLADQLDRQCFSRDPSCPQYGNLNALHNRIHELENWVFQMHIQLQVRVQDPGVSQIISADSFTVPYFQANYVKVYVTSTPATINDVCTILHSKGQAISVALLNQTQYNSWRTVNFNQATYRSAVRVGCFDQITVPNPGDWYLAFLESNPSGGNEAADVVEVVMLTSSPLSNIQVTALDARTQRLVGSALVSASQFFTDGGGNYTGTVKFSNEIPGIYNITVTMRGYSTTSELVKVLPGETKTVVVTLQPSPTVASLPEPFTRPALVAVSTSGAGVSLFLAVRFLRRKNRAVIVTDHPSPPN